MYNVYKIHNIFTTTTTSTAVVLMLPADSRDLTYVLTPLQLSELQFHFNVRLVYFLTSTSISPSLIAVVDT